MGNSPYVVLVCRTKVVLVGLGLFHITFTMDKFHISVSKLLGGAIK